VWREESTRSPVAPPRQRPGRRSPPGRTDHPRNAIRRVLAVSSVLDPVVVKVRVRVDRVRAWKRWPCVGEAALPSRVGLAGAGREAGASVRRPRGNGLPRHAMVSGRAKEPPRRRDPYLREVFAHAVRVGLTDTLPDAWI